MITIVNYGMGNLGSVQNMLMRIGVESEITSDEEVISKAEKLLLPGVGAFDAAMERINESGLKGILDKRVLQDKVPILGICLGMQILTNYSEEGTQKGLGWINAETKALVNNISAKIKIPHMGWNVVDISNPCALTQNFSKEIRFYFVHSYFVKVENPFHSMMRCNYGIQFDAAIRNENIYGVQFHPEKSHKFGMQLLRNFAAL